MLDCTTYTEQPVARITMPQVWLSDYDIILVNSSAGKDSQAMLDVIVEQARIEGVMNRLVVVHCDLGRMEWQGTRTLAAEQAAHYGLPFHVVSRKQDLLDQVAQRGMWPSNKQRYCTSDHKRAQVYKLMTALVAEQAGLGRQVRMLNCMGIRAQESTARAKKAPFQMDKLASNGKRHVDTYYPIFDWTVEQVWARIRQSGVRYHYAYDLGMPRLSCVFCIFAPKAALVLAGKHNPALLDQYVAVEQQIGHKFTTKLSLVQIQAAVKADEATEGIQSWNM